MGKCNINIVSLERQHIPLLGLHFAVLAQSHYTSIILGIKNQLAVLFLTRRARLLYRALLRFAVSVHGYDIAGRPLLRGLRLAAVAPGP